MSTMVVILCKKLQQTIELENTKSWICDCGQDLKKNLDSHGVIEYDKNNLL